MNYDEAIRRRVSFTLQNFGATMEFERWVPFTVGVWRKRSWLIKMFIYIYILIDSLIVSLKEFE